MELIEFLELKRKYVIATINEKIDIYMLTEGLTQTQYRELLELFPKHEFEKLENAMS